MPVSLQQVLKKSAKRSPGLIAPLATRFQDGENESAGRITSVPAAPTRRMTSADRSLMTTQIWSGVNGLELDDPVCLVDARSIGLQGVVAYVGKVHFDKGIWVGVQLTGASVGKGYNDGSVGGRRYFPNVGRKNGVFCHISKVQKRMKDEADPDRVREKLQTPAAQMAEINYVESLKKERKAAILRQNEEKPRWMKNDNEEIYIQRMKLDRLKELRASRQEPMYEDLKDLKGPQIKFSNANSNLSKADFEFLKGLQEAEQNFVVTDPTLPDNPVTFASQNFQRMTGYNLSEIIGKNCRFLQGPNTDERSVNQIRKAIVEGSDCSVLILNYRKDGLPFWNEFFITALRDTKGRVKNYIGVQCLVSPEVAAMRNEMLSPFRGNRGYVPPAPLLDAYQDMLKDTDPKSQQQRDSVGSGTVSRSVRPPQEYDGPTMRSTRTAQDYEGPSMRGMRQQEFDNPNMRSMRSQDPGFDGQNSLMERSNNAERFMYQQPPRPFQAPGNYENFEMWRNPYGFQLGRFPPHGYFPTHQEFMAQGRMPPVQGQEQPYGQVAAPNNQFMGPRMQFNEQGFPAHDPNFPPAEFVYAPSYGRQGKPFPSMPQNMQQQMPPQQMPPQQMAPQQMPPQQMPPQQIAPQQIQQNYPPWNQQVYPGAMEPAYEEDQNNFDTMAAYNAMMKAHTDARKSGRPETVEETETNVSDSESVEESQVNSPRAVTSVMDDDVSTLCPPSLEAKEYSMGPGMSLTQLEVTPKTARKLKTLKNRVDRRAFQEAEEEASES